MLTRKAGRHWGRPLLAKGFYCARIQCGEKYRLGAGSAPEDLPEPPGDDLLVTRVVHENGELDSLRAVAGDGDAWPACK